MPEPLCSAGRSRSIPLGQPGKEYRKAPWLASRSILLSYTHSKHTLGLVPLRQSLRFRLPERDFLLGLQPTFGSTWCLLPASLGPAGLLATPSGQTSGSNRKPGSLIFSLANRPWTQEAPKESMGFPGRWDKDCGALILKVMWF